MHSARPGATNADSDDGAYAKRVTHASNATDNSYSPMNSYYEEDGSGYRFTMANNTAFPMRKALLATNNYIPAQYHDYDGDGVAENVGFTTDYVVVSKGLIASLSGNNNGGTALAELTVDYSATGDVTTTLETITNDDGTTSTITHTSSNVKSITISGAVLMAAVERGYVAGGTAQVYDTTALAANGQPITSDMVFMDADGNLLVAKSVWSDANDANSYLRGFTLKMRNFKTQGVADAAFVELWGTGTHRMVDQDLSATFKTDFLTDSWNTDDWAIYGYNSDGQIVSTSYKANSPYIVSDATRLNVVLTPVRPRIDMWSYKNATVAYDQAASVALYTTARPTQATRTYTLNGHSSTLYTFEGTRPRAYYESETVGYRARVTNASNYAMTHGAKITLGTLNPQTTYDGYDYNTYPGLIGKVGFHTSTATLTKSIFEASKKDDGTPTLGLTLKYATYTYNATGAVDLTNVSSLTLTPEQVADLFETGGENLSLTEGGDTLLSAFATRDEAGNVALDDSLWLGSDLVSVELNYGFFKKNLAASDSAYIDLFGYANDSPNASAKRIDQSVRYCSNHGFDPTCGGTSYGATWDRYYTEVNLPASFGTTYNIENWDGLADSYALYDDNIYGELNKTTDYGVLFAQMSPGNPQVYGRAYFSAGMTVPFSQAVTEIDDTAQAYLRYDGAGYRFHYTNEQPLANNGIGLNYNANVYDGSYELFDSYINVGTVPAESVPADEMGDYANDYRSYDARFVSLSKGLMEATKWDHNGLTPNATAGNALDTIVVKAYVPAGGSHLDGVEVVEGEDGSVVGMMGQQIDDDPADDEAFFEAAQAAGAVTIAGPDAAGITTFTFDAQKLIAIAAAEEGSSLFLDAEGNFVLPRALWKSGYLNNVRINMSHFNKNVGMAQNATVDVLGDVDVVDRVGLRSTFGTNYENMGLPVGLDLATGSDWAYLNAKVHPVQPRVTSKTFVEAAVPGDTTVALADETITVLGNKDAGYRFTLSNPTAFEMENARLRVETMKTIGVKNQWRGFDTDTLYLSPALVEAISTHHNYKNDEGTWEPIPDENRRFMLEGAYVEVELLKRDSAPSELPIDADGDGVTDQDADGNNLYEDQIIVEAADIATSLTNGNTIVKRTIDLFGIYDEATDTVTTQFYDDATGSISIPSTAWDGDNYYLIAATFHFKSFDKNVSLPANPAISAATDPFVEFFGAPTRAGKYDASNNLQRLDMPLTGLFSTDYLTESWNTVDYNAAASPAQDRWTRDRDSSLMYAKTALPRLTTYLNWTGADANGVTGATLSNLNKGTNATTVPYRWGETAVTYQKLVGSSTRVTVPTERVWYSYIFENTAAAPAQETYLDFTLDGMYKQGATDGRARGFYAHTFELDGFTKQDDGTWVHRTGTIPNLMLFKYSGTAAATTVTGDSTATPWATIACKSGSDQ